MTSFPKTVTPRSSRPYCVIPGDRVQVKVRGTMGRVRWVIGFVTAKNKARKEVTVAIGGACGIEAVAVTVPLKEVRFPGMEGRTVE